MDLFVPLPTTRRGISFYHHDQPVPSFLNSTDNPFQLSVVSASSPLETIVVISPSNECPVSTHSQSNAATAVRPGYAASHSDLTFPSSSPEPDDVMVTSPPPTQETSKAFAVCFDDEAQVVAHYCRLLGADQRQLPSFLVNTKPPKGNVCPRRYCGYSTPRSNNLKRHLFEIHESQKKIYFCCGLELRTRGLYELHARLQHMDRDGVLHFVCWVAGCGMDFPRKAGLDRHAQKHLGRHKYLCEHAGCAYATAFRANMTRHGETHVEKGLRKTRTPLRDRKNRLGSGHAKVQMVKEEPHMQLTFPHSNNGWETPSALIKLVDHKSDYHDVKGFLEHIELLGDVKNVEVGDSFENGEFALEGFEQSPVFDGSLDCFDLDLPMGNFNLDDILPISGMAGSFEYGEFANDGPVVQNSKVEGNFDYSQIGIKRTEADEYRLDDNEFLTDSFKEVAQGTGEEYCCEVPVDDFSGQNLDNFVVPDFLEGSTESDGVDSLLRSFVNETEDWVCRND